MTEIVPDGEEYAQDAEASGLILRHACAVALDGLILDDGGGKGDVGTQPASALLLGELPPLLDLV